LARWLSFIATAKLKNGKTREQNRSAIPLSPSILQSSVLQSSVLQYSTLQYSTLQYSALR
jgi:hypothetical protein